MPNSASRVKEKLFPSCGTRNNKRRAAPASRAASEKNHRQFDMLAFISKIERCYALEPLLLLQYNSTHAIQQPLAVRLINPLCDILHLLCAALTCCVRGLFIICAEHNAYASVDINRIYCCIERNNVCGVK